MRCNFRKIIEHARKHDEFCAMLTANRDDAQDLMVTQR